MRFLRGVLLLCGLMTVIVGLVGYQAYMRRDEVANVYVRAYHGIDYDILSFTMGRVEPNLIYSAQRLPAGIDRPSVLLTADGRSLVGWNIANGTQGLVYARVNGTFNDSPIQAIQTYLSGDGKTLYYLEIDAAGQYLTANLLDLASGRRVALTDDSNPKPAPVSLHSFSHLIIPAHGWTMRNRNLVVSNFQWTGARFQFDGYYQIDLSSIDFSQSGGYNLPAAIKLPFTIGQADQQSGGYLSPDGQQFAYWVHNMEQHTEQLYIANLTSGALASITLAEGTTAGSLMWDKGSQILFYTTYDKPVSGFHLYRYDTASQHSELIPLALPEGAITYTTQLDIAVCGSTLFYVANVEWPGQGTSYNRLVSVPLDPPGPGVELFTADRIDIMSCAPTYGWNIANAINQGFGTPFP